MKNIEKYKKDLQILIELWKKLHISIQFETIPDKINEYLRDLSPAESRKIREKIIDFKWNYQKWYSESLVLIKQLLPDRVNDFILQYNKPKNRKIIRFDNYVIEDYIHWIWNDYVRWEWAITKFLTQFHILESLEKRFESSLFDIKSLIQADLFDNELEAAKELLKKWFLRWAWAVVWVVLEEHFQNVCNSHNLKIWKKNPTINDFNDLLKKESIIDISDFRRIQLLWDLRNKCDHKKTDEPIKEDIEDLINWANKIIKSVF